MKARLFIALLAVAGATWLVVQARRVATQRAELAAIKSEIARIEAEAKAGRPQPTTPGNGSDALTEKSVSSAVSEKSPGGELQVRWLEKARALRQMIAQHPDRQIPQLSLLTDTDVLIAAQTLKFDTEDDARKSLSTLRDQAKAKFVPYLEMALGDYAAANGDRIPDEIGELASYLKPPFTSEMLRQYEIVQSGLVSQFRFQSPSNSWIVAERMPVDDQYDTRGVLSATASGKINVIPGLYYTAHAIAAFEAANEGRKPTTATQLQPFLPNTVNVADIEDRFQQWQAHPDTMGVRVQSFTSQTREQLTATLPKL